MANYVTLQTLTNRVLQRANLEGSLDATNAGLKFCTQNEVTDLVNSSLANEVYDLLRESVGDNYFRKTFTFTTTEATTFYTIPSDLLTIISVDVWLGGQYPVCAKRYQEGQRNILRAFPFGWNYTYPVYYQLQGSGPSGGINFLAAPNAGFRIDLNYCPTCPQLVNLTDTWDDINGWSEIAVLDAASKLCIKDGQLDVAQYLDARKGALVAKVRAMGPQRHAGEPEAVNIIENRPNWGDGGFFE